jgi:hypothetical protein
MVFRGPSTQEEEFSNNLAENMATLRANIDKTSDPKFARSLCEWYDKYESLSSKQGYRAMKFWQEINQQEGDANVVSFTTGKPAASLPPQVAVDGKKLHEAMLLAGTKLAFPRIKYKTEEGGTIFIHLLGDRARYPGNLVVKFVPKGQESLGTSVLLLERYVKQEKAVFTTAALANPTMQVLVKKVVEDFPGELAINGREHISCCFCGIELIAGASRKVGYGPICASNYGLPWGDEGEGELVSIQDVT